MTADFIIQRLYSFLDNSPLIRNYIKKLSYRYRLISSCDSKTIAKKSVFSCLLSLSISIIAFLLIYMTNRRLITLITAGIAIYVINSEVVSRMSQRYEIKILTETERMLADVVHYYYVEYRIDNALYRAREHLSIDMKAAADQIYELLLMPDKEEGLREYYDNVPNKYLRSFVSQCVRVMEQGDREHEGSLLFISNLENLQREISIETDKLLRLNMEFMGVILCVVAPIFCIDIVKQFAISLKENMNTFYYGSQGFLLDIGLLAIVLGIYIIMRKSAEYTVFHLSSHKWLYRIDRIRIIKRAMDNYCEKNAAKQERLQRKLRDSGNNIRARHFVLRSFIFAMIMFLLSVGVTVYLRRYSRKQLMTVNACDMESLTSTVRAGQTEAMAETVKTYLKKYKEAPSSFPDNPDDIIEAFNEDGIYYSRTISGALAEEIYSRVKRYSSSYFSFPDLFICLCISIIAYYLPSVLLRYGSSVSRDAMEDEVNQFNAIIGMLMHNETITVKQILIEMESFALVFKKSIRMCIDDYASGDIEALNELMEREPYEPFRRIVENLIRCDSMPVYQAFDEIKLDQDGYISKRKLMNEKSIRRRVFRAYLLAALPFILLFTYGLLPALISSVRELNMLIEEIENMAW
ncbi:MAG TPA: hypothetical protein GX002_07965 [Clostridiales bacterium]|jgi:hypothetical protein|nr:hypothetical protein [Clostridiales bacterium]